jgi:hypothetical protein
MRKLLILTALIFGFCTTAFAEETKSSKYPKIMYLTPDMENVLEIADNGNEVATYAILCSYTYKIESEEENPAKVMAFMIEMLATSEALGHGFATKILNERLTASLDELEYIQKTRVIANSPERKSQTKPISKVLERYSTISPNPFYHLREIDKVYEKLSEKTEK